MKQLLIFIVLSQSLFASGQAYFDSASNPADNAANATTTITIAPPGSMIDGHLVVLIGQVLTAATSITISNTGGQSWNDSGLTIAGTGHTAKVFWCRFNGTWSANPELTFGASNATSAIMHVFIPSGTASTRTWAIDQAPETATYVAPINPFTVNRAGQTTVNGKAVMLTMFFSIDDNTWAYSAGTYNLVGAAQYRNTSSTQMSSMYAAQYFNIAGSAGGNARYTQATNGGDDGATAIITWYDYPIRRGIPYHVIKN